MPAPQVGQSAAPTKVKIVGDFGNVSVPGLSNEELLAGLKGFAELPPKKAAAELREQSQIYTMVLSGGNLSTDERLAATEALKETEALAAQVEKTGELRADKYAELVLAVGYFAGKVFADG